MKKNTVISLLFSLIFLLGSNDGCGGDDDPPKQPVYAQDPELAALKKGVLGRTQQILDVPYEDYVSRFTPSAETSGVATDIASKYRSLIDQEDYGIEDYSAIEEDYLGRTVGRFKEAREEGFDPIRERYISENLYESGPGFEAERDYAEETARGVGDISSEFAYEGIQRKQQQLQYQDALKRGDYTTMYNMALSESNREIAPAQAATSAQLSAAGAGAGLYGQLSNEDLKKYQIEQQQYQSDLEQYNSQGDFGGVGSLIGAGLGVGASFLFPGSIGALGYALPGLVGGVGGGSIGSLFKS